MTFISYAQNFEDVILFRAFKDLATGFYIDVGANDPCEHSVTKAFYDRGWRGINIEPVKHWHDKLVAARPRDINVNQAISDQSGSFDFYEVVETGLSTLDKGIALKHEKAGFRVIPRTVSCVSLNDIIETYCPNSAIQFLKIDAEGAEKSVLLSINLKKYRPVIIVIEATEPLSQNQAHASWEDILLESDYRFCYFDGLNRFYLAAESWSIADRIALPPNSFDEFITAREQALNQHYEKARDYGSSLEAEIKALASQNEALENKYSELFKQYEAAQSQLVQANDERNHLQQEKNLIMAHNAEHVRIIGLLEQELKLVYGGRSWKITKPLRMLSQALSGTPADNGNSADSTPQFQTSSNDYIDFVQDGTLIHFHKGALADQRGIGRVSKELLAQFQRLTRERSDETEQPKREIFYFSSIHWCPEKLPHPSVITIHDVIPLILKDVFDGPRREWQSKFKAIAQQADHIIAISETTAKDTAQYLDIPPDRITVIHNGITPLPQTIQHLSTLPDKPYVIFLGSNDKHKNLEVVFNAFTLIKDPEIHLCLAGNNKDLITQAKKLKILDRVTFLGVLNDAQLAEAISKAKALVFPSLYEGFGLPPLEAALCGVPSICSNRPAMNEILSESCAIFVDPSDAQGWANAITLLSKEPATRNLLAKNAREVALNLSWDRCGNKLITTLDGLAESHSS